VGLPEIVKLAAPRLKLLLGMSCVVARKLPTLIWPERPIQDAVGMNDIDPAVGIDDTVDLRRAEARPVTRFKITEEAFAGPNCVVSFGAMLKLPQLTMGVGRMIDRRRGEVSLPAIDAPRPLPGPFSGFASRDRRQPPRRKR